MEQVLITQKAVQKRNVNKTTEERRLFRKYSRLLSNNFTEMEFDALVIQFKKDIEKITLNNSRYEKARVDGNMPICYGYNVFSK